MNKFIFYISLLFLFTPDFALSQNSKETIEKRRMEKYIELGSGDFSILDSVNIINPSDTDAQHIFGYVSSEPKYQLYSSGGSNVVSIDSNGDTFFTGGDVGVGNNNPLGLLHSGASIPTSFAPDAGADELVLSTSGSEAGMTIASTTTSAINFGTAGAGNGRKGRIQYNFPANELRLFTNDLERVTIDDVGDVGIEAGDLTVVGSGKGLIFENGGNTALTYYKTYSGSGSSGNLTWNYKSTRIGNKVHITIKMVLSSGTVAAGTGNGASDTDLTPQGNLTSLVNFDAGNQQETHILYTTARAFNLYTYYTDGTSTAAQTTPAGTYFGTWSFELGM